MHVSHCRACSLTVAPDVRLVQSPQKVQLKRKKQKMTSSTCLAIDFVVLKYYSGKRLRPRGVNAE